MPRTIVPTSAPGTVDTWGYGGAATSWQAVLYGSGDDSFVYSDIAAATSDFHCGTGWAPVGGRVMAVTLHYRVRQDNINLSDVEFIITQNAVQHTVGSPLTLTDATWQEGEIRIREDWLSGTRFTSAEVGILGVGVRLINPPTTGRVELSQLWLEVEYVDSYIRYDPFDGVLPDAVVGPLNWLALGAAPAVINPSNYLVITDAALGVSKKYLRVITSIDQEYKEDYVTEVELRVTLTDLSVTPSSYLGNIFTLMDTRAAVLVGMAKSSGDYFLTYTAENFVTFPPNYTKVAPFPYNGEDVHLRIVIDRDNTPDSYGRTQVFVNYADTPLLDIATAQLSKAATVNPVYFFGTYNGSQAEYALDYITWKHYKKRGNTFRHWSNWDSGTNEISSDSADTEIVSKVMINPPGITAGQSDNAAVLDVIDPTVICEIYQLEQLLEAAPTTYKIDIDYKMDIPAVEGELVVQRTSDLWYWDETGSSWQATFQAVTLPNQITRSRLSVTTGLNVTSLEDDAIIVTIRRRTAVLPAYKILVYRVHLVEE